MKPFEDTVPSCFLKLVLFTNLTLAALNNFHQLDINASSIKADRIFAKTADNAAKSICWSY